MGSCKKCTSKDLIRVELVLKGGPVAFCSCRSCEHRWWTDEANGSPMGLPNVLGKVAA